MAETPHTPEFWVVRARESNGCKACPEIWADRRWVATFCGTLPDQYRETLANAYRAAIAVNCCHGVHSDTLAAQSVAELIAERDGLRSALQRMLDWGIDEVKEGCHDADGVIDPVRAHMAVEGHVVLNVARAALKGAANNG